MVALRGPSLAQSSLSQEGARLPVVGTQVYGLPCPSPHEYFTRHPPGSAAVAPALPGERAETQQAVRATSDSISFSSGTLAKSLNLSEPPFPHL